MYKTGRVAGYEIRGDTTEIRIIIPENLERFMKSKKTIQAGVFLEDGRSITPIQRKKIYATLRDISYHTGYPPEEAKEWMKYFYISRTGRSYFSLSDCSVDTARKFINILIDYCLEEGVPTKDRLTERTEDINYLLYKCITNKKCAICGRNGEIHHWDAIGMGNNRKTYDDSLNRKICLCRTHHTIAHSQGNKRFAENYHVYGIVYKEEDNE